MTERNQVNLRLDRGLLAELDELARIENLERPELARRILREGVDRHRQEVALGDYAEGRVTASRAAELAGISVYDMLDLIHERGIVHELDPVDLAAIRTMGVPATSTDNEGFQPRGPGLRRVTVRVAESPAGYAVESAPVTAADRIAAARDRFRPTAVRQLFVGESSPAGGTHFYLANSNLFRAVRAAFVQAYGSESVPDGDAFLGFFADRGNWLVDVANEPVNHLSDHEREDAIRAGIPVLAETIAASEPIAIVVVKATVGKAVHEAATTARWHGDVTVLPFPVRQWRAAFIDRLAALVSEAGQVPDESAHSAAPPRLDNDVLTQRVTEKDLARGQIRIAVTGRGKTFFPSTSQRINVTLRGRSLDAHYDPHYDPDQQRSGVVRIGKPLASLVRPDERLRITRSAGGNVSLD